MSNFAVIYDNDFQTAQPDGPERFSCPFDGVAADYVLEQDYMQRKTYFTPLPLNTPHPDYTNYYLVKESPLQSAGVADVMKWTRTYAQVPATRSDYSSMLYNFIGFTGYISMAQGSITNNVPGRKRFNDTINVRLQYDYFIVGTGFTYTTPKNIPVNRAQHYYMRIGTTSTVGGVTVWTPTYTLGSTDDVLFGCPVDNIGDTAADLSNFITGIVPCIPSRSTYMGWMAAGTEIIPEDSALSRWQGNIYVRETKYILAE